MQTQTNTELKEMAAKHESRERIFRKCARLSDLVFGAISSLSFLGGAAGALISAGPMKELLYLGSGTTLGLTSYHLGQVMENYFHGKAYEHLIKKRDIIGMIGTTSLNIDN